MTSVGKSKKAPPKAKGKPKQTTTNQSKEHPQHKRKQVQEQSSKEREKKKKKLKSTTQGIWTSETYGRRTHGRDPALIPTGSLRFTRKD